MAIFARNFFLSYVETVVLDGIDLSVPSGSVFAPLGPNGPGKTTTVKILSTSWLRRWHRVSGWATTSQRMEANLTARLRAAKRRRCADPCLSGLRAIWPNGAPTRVRRPDRPPDATEPT